MIPGYDPKTAPSIVLPEREHWDIPNLKGEYDGSDRDLLARDARNLRKHTHAPNEKIQELIDYAKNKHPEVYRK